MSPRRPAALVIVAALLVLATGCGTSSTHSTAGAGKALIGTFALDRGRCTAQGATGTYFRMVDPGGTVAQGKYFLNPDSACHDQSYSVQTPGTDGGLVTGTFQPGAHPAFDTHGNALASQIVKPGTFTAIQFAISTASTDPQTKKRVPAPRITDLDGKLSGEISSWSAAWNNLYFNQGSPKPDGSRPGLTTPLTGTYDETTGRFVITWASQVVGGPFNGFTGAWHLQGTFHPAS